MTISYKIVTYDGVDSLSVYVAGELHVISEDSHPLYRHIVLGLHDRSLSEAQVRDMVVSVGKAIVSTIDSDHVTLSDDGSGLLFDGQRVDNTLSRHILRIFREQGAGAATPWIRFMEKLALNPSKLSRIHLHSWLDRVGDFTITQSGDILGYKSVGLDRLSHTSGSEDVTVNGRVHRGRIPNPDGALVSMPRELVDGDREVGCSVGLHIGNYEYANSFCSHGSVLLLVSFSPEHVVSVPSDCGYQKLRACQYEVLCEAERRQRIATALWNPSPEVMSAADDDDDDDRCDRCGDHSDDLDDGVCQYCDDEDDDRCDRCGDHSDDLDDGVCQYCDDEDD